MSLASCILLLCLGQFLVPALAFTGALDEDFELFKSDEVLFIESSETDDNYTVPVVILDQQQARVPVPATPVSNEDGTLIWDVYTHYANEVEFVTRNASNQIENKTNSDEDIIVGSGEPVERRYFYPIDKPWQLEKCEQLNLGVVQVFHFHPEATILDTPASWFKVVEDEHSFFRALSLCVCGSEYNHADIRQRVSETIRTDHRMKDLLGEENHLAHLILESEPSCATKVEIIASAVLLNTPIYVYETSKQTWELIDPNIGPKRKDLEMKMDKCIYLHRISINIYYVVADVKPNQHRGYFTNPEWILDDDIKIALLSEPEEIRYFNPVEEDWQKEKCREFGLEIETSFHYNQNPLILSSPKKLVLITEDAYCFYRALSHCITGTQNNYEIIRSKVFEIVRDNTDLQELYKKKSSLSIQSSSTTDLEITASTLLLNTSIYVYSGINRTWNLFNKDIVHQLPVDKFDKCIYMSQISPNSYDVVEGVVDYFAKEEMLDISLLG